MEYLPGADLAAIVKNHGPMPPARAVHLIRQACASLAEAHAVGIIHRDIKPENLYITRMGEEHDFLKLLDFGIARVSDADARDNLTKTGVVPGTPAYIAPELWLGKRADARSDIYSLGATLLFLISGAPPDMSRDGTTEPTQRGRSGSSSPPGLPLRAHIKDVTERCLDRNPDHRFQTVADLRAALDVSGIPQWTNEDAQAFCQGSAPQLGPVRTAGRSGLH